MGIQVRSSPGRTNLNGINVCESPARSVLLIWPVLRFDILVVYYCSIVMLQLLVSAPKNCYNPRHFSALKQVSTSHGDG